MKQDDAVLLMLVCMLAAWAWVWSVVATRRTARGNNRFIAHLMGALAGSGAACGVFCLSVALLMPDTGDAASIEFGVLGALLLCAYLGALRPPQQKASKRTKAEPAAPMAAAAGTKTDEPPVPRAPSKDSLLTRRQQQQRKQEAFLRAERKRVAQENTLGMSFGDFLMERIEGHLMFWLWVLLAAVWGYLFVSVLSALGWFAGLIISVIATCLLTAVFAIACALVLPAILLLLVLLPFIILSIHVEARWRIRHGIRYVPNPVTVRHPLPAPPRRCSVSWLVPLAIGLWVGSTWGKDD